MPKVIEYEAMLAALLGQGFKSLYYNSGSFGFPPGVDAKTLGWIGPPDTSIRPEASAFTRQVSPPFESNLARLGSRAWQECLPGVVWAMPKSHWAYELDFGSREWMPAVLAGVGIESSELAPLTTGNAIEFAIEEGEAFDAFLSALLGNLSGSSDFQLAWPGQPVICTVHHHKQLWWTTSDAALHARLDALTA